MEYVTVLHLERRSAYLVDHLCLISVESFIRIVIIRLCGSDLSPGHRGVVYQQ